MLDEIDLKRVDGLTDEEAAERLAKEGYNELPTSKPRGIIPILWDAIREPMILLLLAAGVLYLLLGDVQEALILLGWVFVVMGISFYQEHKTERALEALRDLSSPRALVIRGGQQKRIPGREVARGDLMVLSEGDRVPADGLVLECTNLSVDESLLTGESVPVRKDMWDGVVEMGRPGGDDLPFVYSGTLAVKGQGVALATATGAHTEMGKIGRALNSVQPEKTLLQKEVRRLVRALAVAGLLLCALVVIIYGLTREDWLDGLLAGIALAMAILPEEFPVVLAIFLALGAWRMSQKRVLTRRSTVIETLGSATVLCVDKTGTLTQNHMSVSRLWVDREADGEVDERLYDVSEQGHQPLPETFHRLIEFSVLASHRDPFDPMELAFKEFVHRYLADTEHLHADWSLVREYPLSRELLALSHVWRSPGGSCYVIAAKGAPEAIMDLCHMAERQRQSLSQGVMAMASDGLRVLGVAQARFGQGELPLEQHDFQFEFVGLVGLADPVRPTVRAALEECYNAGIRVVMITGDYPVTAQSIAHQIGLKPLDLVITGPELDNMDDGQLQEKIRRVNIFARVVPEQKLRLVNALKADSEIVAMTGDGVNDAPALKSAHIGIAMGGRGTDVAREAGSLVLLDDDFSSIEEAVRLGRRIFDNLKRAMAYILAIHIPIAGMSLLPVLFGWPLALLPMHIVFLEMVIDPTCSVVYEAEPGEEGLMKRRPRSPKEPVLGLRTVLLSVLQGISVLAVVLTVFVYALYRGQGAEDARALAFTTLVVANLGLITTNRSWAQTIVTRLRVPNTPYWWVIGGTLGVLLIVLYMPFMRDLFLISTLHVEDLMLCLIAGAMSCMWFEVFKVVMARRGRSMKVPSTAYRASKQTVEHR